MADISKIKIGDDEYSIKDKKRHEHENKDVLDLVGKGTHGNLTLDGALHWCVTNGGVIESVKTDETTGDITLFVRFVPNPAIPAEEIKIKQSFDVPESVDGTVLVNSTKLKTISHRGYSVVAPENTIPAYVLSKKQGFEIVEADVVFTSDNVAVLLHDPTIDRTSNGSGRINNLTYNEVLQYDFGSWKSADYAGTKIPTFEEFIKLCRNLGLHPYIEFKDDTAYTQAQIESIVDMVKRNGMKGNVTYISFSKNLLTYVKNYDSTARLGLSISTINQTAIDNVLSLKTGANEVFAFGYYVNINDTAVSLCINNNLPLEVWTVNDESAVLALDTYVSAVCSDGLNVNDIWYKAYVEDNYVPDIDTGGGETDTTKTWENDTITLTASDLMFGYGQLNNPPYYSPYVARAGYWNDDISVTEGYEYTVNFVSSVDTAQVALQFYSTQALAMREANQDKVSFNVYGWDSGWQENGYTVASPTCADGQPLAFMLINFRMDTNNTAVTDGFIESVTITRRKTTE